MVVYILVFRFGRTVYTGITIGFYALSVPVVLFLLAVLCFLIYEEWWRVDGKICDTFGPVEMENCHEGQNADGYQGLCWFVISVAGCVLIGLVVLAPRLMPGIAILHNVSQVYRTSLQLHIFLFVVLVLGVVFYTFSITLLIYQTSCGDWQWRTEATIPQGDVWHWDFDQAERVLVFFDVGMILWHFSFFVHSVEYVCAYASKSWLFTKRPRFLITTALYSLFRYHLGSVLLASIIVPIGRLPRNLLLGVKSLVKQCPVGPLQHMTSDGLCFQAVLGGGSYFRACRQSGNLFKRQENLQTVRTLNSGNYIVWVFQLLLILVAPVYVMYWIQHKDVTYRGKTTREISSVISMGIYALFFSWFLGSLYACFVRGLLHGSVISYLIDAELHGRKVDSVFFSAARNEDFHPSEVQLDPGEVKKPTNFVVPPMTQEEPSRDVDLSGPPPPSRGERDPNYHKPRGERVEPPVLAAEVGDVPPPSREGQRPRIGSSNPSESDQSGRSDHPPDLS